MPRPFFTERLARGSARHPWIVVGIWAALLVLGLFLGSGIGRVLTTESRLYVEPEAEHANRLLEERFSAAVAPREALIVQSDRYTVDDPAYKAFVDGLLAD